MLAAARMLTRQVRSAATPRLHNYLELLLFFASFIRDARFKRNKTYFSGTAEAQTGLTLGCEKARQKNRTHESFLLFAEANRVSGRHLGILFRVLLPSNSLPFARIVCKQALHTKVHAIQMNFAHEMQSLSSCALAMCHTSGGFSLLPTSRRRKTCSKLSPLSRNLTNLQATSHIDENNIYSFVGKPIRK